MLATQSVTFKMGCIKVTEGDEEKEKQYTRLFFFSFKPVKSQMIPE